MISQATGRVALVTGATGRLGQALVRGWSSHPVVGLARSHTQACVDLTHADDVQACLARVRPAVVVHAACLTDVDLCEANPGEAHRQLEVATRHLVQAMATHVPHARLVYLSSDQVYDGEGPHAEEHVQPCNVYGRSKLAGERVALSHPRTLVVRTNFLSVRVPDRPSFADWVLSKLSAGEEVPAFSDVLFNPLYVDRVAEIIERLVHANIHGTINVGASGPGQSKADAARWWARRLGFPAHLIRPIGVDDAGLRAPRPHDMRMDVSRLTRALGQPPPSTEHALERVAAAWTAWETA